jgi:hypothetical protein
MPGVFREIVMSYNGQTYSIEPTNKMLRKIESEGVSIFGTVGRMANGASTGDIPIFDLACIVSGFLREAGAMVDEDQVVADMMEDLSTNNAQNIIAMFEQIALAISPPDENPKKDAAQPARKTPGQRAKKSAK